MSTAAQRQHLLRHGRKRSCIQDIVDFFVTIWHAVCPGVDLKEESFDAFQGLLVCVTAPHVSFRGARAEEQRVLGFKFAVLLPHGMAHHAQPRLCLALSPGSQEGICPGLALVQWGGLGCRG